MLEADWTDAYRANEFVHGISKDQTADQSLAGFTRFPQWMWRNTDFRDLVTSIRSYNNSGYMTEAADISKKDKVLEIGTGSGYQAAILGELAKEVYTIEIIPELAVRSTQILQQLVYKNVFVKAGNGYLGIPEQAPFDAIVVTAAPDEVPQALVDQLAVNGKMVIPVGTENQEMLVIKKTKKGVTEKRTMKVRFVPMTGKPTKWAGQRAQFFCF